MATVNYMLARGESFLYEREERFWFSRYFGFIIFLLDCVKFSRHCGPLMKRGAVSSFLECLQIPICLFLYTSNIVM